VAEIIADRCAVLCRVLRCGRDYRRQMCCIV